MPFTIQYTCVCSSFKASIQTLTTSYLAQSQVRTSPSWACMVCWACGGADMSHILRVLSPTISIMTDMYYKCSGHESNLLMISMVVFFLLILKCFSWCNYVVVYKLLPTEVKFSVDFFLLYFILSLLIACN